MKVSILLLKPLSREIRTPSQDTSFALLDGPWRHIALPAAKTSSKIEILPAGAIIKADMDDPSSNWPNVVINGWPAAARLKKGADFKILN
jgi:hypothetical protein